MAIQWDVGCEEIMIEMDVNRVDAKTNGKVTQTDLDSSSRASFSMRSTVDYHLPKAKVL